MSRGLCVNVCVSVFVLESACLAAVPPASAINERKQMRTYTYLRGHNMTACNETKVTPTACAEPLEYNVCPALKPSRTTRTIIKGRTKTQLNKATFPFWQGEGYSIHTGWENERVSNSGFLQRV